jgi:hypothetical protein
VAGLALLIYPYFTDSVITLVVVGVAIGVGLFVAIRAGW